MNGYPEGLKHFDYFECARQFLTAYDDLTERPPPKSWPRYFMLCHAIELALKGYLVALTIRYIQMDIGAIFIWE